MSKSYAPYCCFVYLTENYSYLTNISKCDEELILKEFISVEIFKKDFEKGKLLETSISSFRIENEFYHWECKPSQNDRYFKLVELKSKNKEIGFNHRPIDIFCGIGEGRIYVEEGRFNSVEEGKRKLLDKDGFLIHNPEYRFKNLEIDNELFKFCKLG